MSPETSKLLKALWLEIEALPTQRVRILAEGRWMDRSFVALFDVAKILASLRSPGTASLRKGRRA
jgi:hypothetical protein